MRLFLAVDLDAAARRSAEAQIATLVRALGKKGVSTGVRWIPAANLHLTIRFIGEADDEGVRRLREQLTAPMPLSAFDLAFGGVGAFPSTGRPRIIWMGIGAGGTELRAVHAEIERRVQSAAFPADARPFSGHLTIGRVKDLGRRQAAAVRAVLEAWNGETFRVRVERVTLYRSHLKPSGSEYEPQLDVPLLGAAGN